VNRSTLRKVAAVLNNAADHLETAFELLKGLKPDSASMNSPEADAVIKASQRIQTLYEKGLAQ
jgi:hypothetical protein